MFYQVVSSSETDSLTIFNSIFKSALFVWLLYKMFPYWFGAESKTRAPLRHQSVA
jgi:hypothetical protein